MTVAEWETHWPAWCLRIRTALAPHEREGIELNALFRALLAEGPWDGPRCMDPAGDPYAIDSYLTALRFEGRSKARSATFWYPDDGSGWIGHRKRYGDDR